MHNSAASFIFNNAPQLFSGIEATVLILCASIALSIPGGFIFGALRCAKNKVLRYSTRAFLEFYRALPMALLLLAGFFLIPQIFQIQVSGEFVAVTAFSFWGSVEIGELIRGAIESLPKIQTESGTTLGLSKTQLYRYILIPQALPRVLPGAVNLITRMVKTSSLIILVGVVDVVKQIQQIIERTKDPLIGYIVLAAVFFALCFPLAQASKRLEKRFNTTGEPL